MTGRQVTPERANPQSIDIKKIVEGCGVECLEYEYVPDIDKTISFIKKLFMGNLLSDYNIRNFNFFSLNYTFNNSFIC